MAEQRFNCTLCGQCCRGWIPLTLDDALANAGRFPLAMVWTPVRPGSRAFDLTTRLGTTVQLRNHKQVAVLIAPTAYIPPSFPCPALTADNLCGIQGDKPQRCRTMPFYPYREENDQADILVPRKGWACDTSAAAPVIYRDKTIIDREAFDREREALTAQAPSLRAYAETMLKQNAALTDYLTKAAQNPVAGHFAVNFSSYLRLNRSYDLIAFAKAQHPVLTAFANRTEKTPELADYHTYYKESAAELSWFAQRS